MTASLRTAATEKTRRKRYAGPVSTDRPWPLPPPPVKLQCFFCPGETYSPDGICGQCKADGKDYGSDEMWPGGAGEFLSNLLNPVSQPGPPWTHTFVPAEPERLTSADPEPPPGTIVRDDLGTEWELSDEDEGGLWWRTDADDDPESWTKVAGNYGPVTILEWGAEP